MKPIYFLCCVLLMQYGSLQAQFSHSSNTAHISLLKAIEVNNNIVRERVENFEKKAQQKPLMFVNVKKKISELNRVSNNLVSYIKFLQGEVGLERVLYELVEDDYYNNILFTTDDALTTKGEKLKVKIDSLYQIGRKINIHALTHIDDFAKEHFDTDETYFDSYEKKINFFEHVFYDRSNYGLMMTMNYLLLDVKLFQLLYYRSVMSY